MNWFRELSFFVAGIIVMALIFGFISFICGIVVFASYAIKKKSFGEDVADVLMEKRTIPMVNFVKIASFIYLQAAWGAVVRLYVDILNLNFAPSFLHSVAGFLFTIPIGSFFFVLFGLAPRLMFPFAWVFSVVFPGDLLK
jgi:hypothetical protein